MGKVLATNLSELLKNEALTTSNAVIPFSLGFDRDNILVVKDLSVMPHVVVCGVSGTGKTSFLQTVLAIISAMKSTNDVKYLVYSSNFSSYRMFEHDYHLLSPIVFDAVRFCGSLQWACVEIQKRYRLFAEARVNDITSYNCKKVEERLPRVIIVIDDMFELLSVYEKEAVTNIQFILNRGRQAGIHCIIVSATSSNSIMKREIIPYTPCKICFAVASAKDSNTVLGQSAAAKLSSPGEFVFKGINSLNLFRALFIPDEQLFEIDSVQKINEMSFNSEVQGFQKKALPQKDRFERKEENYTLHTSNGDYDERLPESVRVVIETQQCSVSMLQRRIKLGYSRAARIVDQMEELGIVGPYQGAMPRVVLIDMPGWEKLAKELGIDPNYSLDISLQREMSK